MLLNFKSKNVSFGGVMAALSLVILYAASVVPSGKFALVAAASYAIGVCVSVMGVKLSALAYIAVSLLSFLIIPNKALALMFAAFFGNYPIVKLYIEKIRRLWLEWIVKIICFNVYAVILYLLLRQFIAAEIMLPILFLGLNIVFIIYDIVFNFVVTKILLLRSGKNL